MKISGSVAIVTGGAGGFGKAFSEELLKRGGKVCIADVNTVEGLKTVQVLKQKYGDDSSMFMKCDVTKDADFRDLWKAALGKFKSIDIMVNNAGIANEHFPEKTVAINLLGLIKGTTLAVEHMRKDLGGKGGLIVNVASTAGLYPVFWTPTYAASKYGSVGYTRSWADNPLVHAFGVSFACLCPAFSDTPIFTDSMIGENPPMVTYEENKDIINTIVKGIGVNKMSDVASAFIGLVEKPDNNGAVLTIDAKRGPRYQYTKHPHRL